MKLKRTEEDFLKLLKQVVELVLHCAKKVEIFKDQYDIQEEINRVVSPAFSEVSNYMKEYFKNSVGKPFGKSNMLWSSSRAESEIKVIFVALGNGGVNSRSPPF